MDGCGRSQLTHFGYDLGCYFDRAIFGEMVSAASYIAGILVLVVIWKNFWHRLHRTAFLTSMNFLILTQILKIDFRSKMFSEVSFFGNSTRKREGTFFFLSSLQLFICETLIRLEILLAFHCQLKLGGHK